PELGKAWSTVGGLVVSQQDVEVTDAEEGLEVTEDGEDAEGPTDAAQELSDLELEGDIAADYVEGLLDIADLDDYGRTVAEEVARTGEPKSLAAMSPFERKIVHDAVAAAGQRSESEGEEPNRRVVVFPAQ